MKSNLFSFNKPHKEVEDYLYFCKITKKSPSSKSVMDRTIIRPRKKTMVGLVDADLLCGGTRHPNLALLKIAGFLKDNHVPFNLIIDQDVDLSIYKRIYISQVFSFTSLPSFYIKSKGTPDEKKFALGGTGNYADDPEIKSFAIKRCNDMQQLENDWFLNQYHNRRGGTKVKGIDMARQMPYYHLYDEYIERQLSLGHKRDKYKDYLDYSIGFLTRGCIRHCPFCVNRLESTIHPYSKLEWFVDQEINENGKRVRPYIYLWDDNFLASDVSVWKPLLQQLIDSKMPFQFRQGLDERMLTQSPHGEEMAEMLSKAKYHGDFIFAFDNWRDRDIITKALKIWKSHNPKKGTKFYLFCGFKQEADNLPRFYRDIWELFQRIRILMQYGCVGYVMRHQDYHNAPISNLYVQIARWCNQPQFYKKMSFWEFTYRNQSYWEEHNLNCFDRPLLMSFDEFEKDVRDGYYDKVKMCLPLKDIVGVLNLFPEHREELLELFNYKMDNLVDPSLWENTQTE